MNHKYDWKRYWCPVDGHISLDDLGYLYNPESEYSHFHHQDIKSYEEIAVTPCLILLGEPGIGKTYELEKSIKLDLEIYNISLKQHYYDRLNHYQDEVRFVDNVFNNEKFLSAKKENSLYILTLDSLDECKIRIDAISELLSYEIKKHYWDKLYLRITCRTFEWSTYLENSLKELYMDANVGKYELVLLTKKDVDSTLSENNIDPEKFYTELIIKGVQPLTTKPITLNFIINLFKEKGYLPTTRKDVYEEGLKLLIREQNQSRIESKLNKTIDPEIIYLTVQHIAMLMIICNRNTIVINDVSKLETDISIPELTMGSIVYNETNIKITEEIIREALNTGLFVLAGKNRLGLFHQTFAEYLAAKCLFDNKFSMKQIIHLFFQKYDELLKSIPQLNETIAWIATFYPELFEMLIDNDIEVLLRSDVSIQLDEMKSKIIERLLDNFERKEIYDPNYSLKKHYHKLKHANIANQLKDIINNKERNYAIRYEAIDIIERCETVELQEDILSIFCDRNEILGIRQNAGWALKKIADLVTRLKMKQVLFSDLSEDITDELKGISLLSLWPGQLSVVELFSVLTEPKKENLYGSYSSFIHEFNTSKLTIDELIIGLNWVARQKTKHSMSMHHHINIIDGIMLESWKFINEEKLLIEFARAVLHLISNYDDIVSGKHHAEFYKLYESDDVGRRGLIRKLFESFDEPLDQVYKLRFPGKEIILSKDFFWLLDQSSKEILNEKKEAWAIIAHFYFDEKDKNMVESLLEVSQVNSILIKVFNYYLTTIELDSEKAKKAKADYLKYHKPRKLDDKRYLRKLAYKERLMELFEDIKDGKVAQLWLLLFHLCYDPENDSNNNEFASEIESLPGWKILSKEEKDIIISTGKTYLIEIDPQNESWFGSTNYHRPALAGYKLLRWFYSNDIDLLNSLPDEILIKWTLIVLVYPAFYGEDILCNSVLDYFYNRIKSEVLLLFDKVLTFETQRDEYIHLPARFQLCWDENISNILFAKLNDEKLLPNCYSSILNFLLKKEHQPSIEFSLQKLDSLTGLNNKDLNKIINTASQLFYYKFQLAWPIIYRIIRSNEELGREIFLNIASNKLIEVNWFDNTTEEQLANLYVWLRNNFPTEEDIEIGEAHFVSNREDVSHFRDNIITLLRDRGNSASLTALQEIKIAFPDIEWLDRIIYLTKINTRIRNWNPPTPLELTELLNNTTKRFIKNESDLISLIFDSLNKLNLEMHGNPPSVCQIWNTDVYKPKKEKELSDFIKIHLQRDLNKTIINREVELKPPTNIKRGQNIDILVQTFSMDKKNPQPISVIIEVKGSWNNKLKTDMQNQLLNRYLKDNSCNNGIYLIGWFLCNSWNKDYRKTNHLNLSFDDAQAFFMEQAKLYSIKDKYVHSYILDCRL